MNKTAIITEIKELIKEGKEKILPTKWYPTGVIGACYNVDYAKYAGWHTKVMAFLDTILPVDDIYVKKIKSFEANYYSDAESVISILNAVVEYIEKGLLVVKEEESLNTDYELRRLFNRFHRIARQFRARHEGRPTIEVNDEYDVQDLLHSLLRLFFDDVRAEEWTPSYAGKSARMDFLIKNEHLVIEVKKTRIGLADKEIGDQLIVDVERYKTHPDCKKLICFIYDPEGRIGNPDGIMRDLNEQHNGFAEVIIEPAI